MNKFLTTSVLAIAFCTLPLAADAMKIKTGSYTGNATDNRAITGVGFQPTFVWTRNAAGGAGGEVVTRTSSMGTNESIESSGGVVTNEVKSLDADGFTIGTGAASNGDGVTYIYLAISDNSDGDFKVGSYTGDGAASLAITGVGFQPVFGMVWDAGAVSNTIPFIKFNTHGANESQPAAGAAVTDAIKTFDADGFTVGANADTNTSAAVYYYAMWKDSVNVIDQGSYSGNATDNRNIVINDAFQPDFVLVQANGGTSVQRGIWHPDSTFTADDSHTFSANDPGVNHIQAINADGFQVGTDTQVNENAITNNWVALKSTAAAAAGLQDDGQWFLLFD